MRAIRFVGGPADKHIAALQAHPREFLVPILPPRHEPDRRMVAVYRIATVKGETVYRHEEDRDE